MMGNWSNMLVFLTVLATMAAISNQTVEAKSKFFPFSAFIRNDFSCFEIMDSMMAKRNFWNIFFWVDKLDKFIVEFYLNESLNVKIIPKFEA